MQIIGKDTTARPCVATIGTFDGVHRGHQFVVQQVMNQARERGLDAVVLTFPNHPLQVLQENFQPQMLTLSDEKERLLQQTGVDKVVLMDFTKELAGMTARDFMKTILKERLNAQVLLMGYDNHFGHDRKGFDDYRRYGQEQGIEVIGCEELASEQRISSTAIRQALLNGDVDTAHQLLGYHYSLQGEVVQGFQNGRKLGYPTANLQVNPCKLIPENGAYLVICQLSALNPQPSALNSQPSALNPQPSTLNPKPSTLNPQPSTLNPKPSPLYGMLNIGTRPTLHNGRQRSIEVHIFGYDGNLYNQTLTVELLQHLRKEQEFATLDDLQKQLAADEAKCRMLLQSSH